MLFFPSEQLHICWNVSYLNEEAKENLTHETVRLLSMKKSKYFVRLFFLHSSFDVEYDRSLRIVVRENRTLFELILSILSNSIQCTEKKKKLIK